MMTRRRRALHPRLESLLLKPAKPDMRSKKRRRMLATRRYLFRVISKAWRISTKRPHGRSVFLFLPPFCLYCFSFLRAVAVGFVDIKSLLLLMCWCYWRPPLLLPKKIVFFFCWLNGFLVLPTRGRSSAFVVGENWVAVGNWLMPLCLVPSTKCQVPSWFEGGFLVLLTRGSRWELSGGWELTDATLPLCHCAHGTATCHPAPGTMPLCCTAICHPLPGRQPLFSQMLGISRHQFTLRRKTSEKFLHGTAMSIP